MHVVQLLQRAIWPYIQLLMSFGCPGQLSQLSGGLFKWWKRRLAIASGFLLGVYLILGAVFPAQSQAFIHYGPSQPVIVAQAEGMLPVPNADESDDEADATSAESADAEEVPDTINSPIADIREEIGNFLPPTPQVSQGVIRFDGHTDIIVGVSAASEGQNRLALQQRIREIRQRLYQIARTNFDPDQLDVIVAGDSQTGRNPIVYVNSPVFDGPQYLMTVTSADAKVLGVDDPWQRADDIRAEVERGLIRFKQERQPDMVLRQSAMAGGLLLLLAFGSWGIVRLQRRVMRERARLKSESKTQSSPTGPPDVEVDGNGDVAIATPNPSITGSSSTTTPGEPHRLTTALRQQMATQQRRTVLDILRPILQVIQVVLWGAGLYFVLGLIPYTRWIQPILVTIMPLPLQLLALFWGTNVLIRLSAALVDRSLLALQDRMVLSPEASQRMALRFSTFSQVMRSVIAFFLWAIATLIGLSIVGIQVAPLIAGAGLLGLGISFASQNLIKDVINGFFILVEDQYGVGDVVVIGDVAGFVENMNLRITQLRNEEGRLITIPNNTITVVQNLSKEWSRVDLMIDVAHSADIDQALLLIKETAYDMTEDRQWRSLILEPPSLLGVDRLDYRGATVRIWIKTQPLKQWEVAREYRRRLKIAFDQAGIEIAAPQQWITFQNMLNTHSPRSDDQSHTNGHHQLPSDAQSGSQVPD
ncbi:MAG: mechanosensitive ion channel family protein [Thainema sp.]